MDSFVNGLILTAPTANQGGRTFSRFIVEWATQILGWELLDDNGITTWTNVAASGSDGCSLDSPRYPTNFKTVSSTPFLSSHAGSYLTLKNLPLRRSGIYRIDRVLSSSEVQLSIKYGVHEDGIPYGSTGIEWRLWSPTVDYVPTSTNIAVLKGRGAMGSGYDFHLHISVRNTNSYFPEFIISPFASWNPATHTWNDTKRTSALGIDNYSNSLYNTSIFRIFAVGDSDRMVIAMRVEDSYFAWHFIYLGEADSFPNESLDPKPCVLWTGSNAGVTTAGDDSPNLFGTGYASNINGRGRWLAEDDVTTVSGYASFAHCPVNYNYNWYAKSFRLWSTHTRSRFLQKIICECRTTGHMEFARRLKRVWLTSRDCARCLPIGVNSEYAHIIGGLTLPWNNSKIWYERG